MWVKVRLVIMGLFGLAFGLLELVALLTPAIRCEGKLEVYEGLSGRLAFVLAAFFIVAALETLWVWRSQRRWSDAGALSARLEALKQAASKPAPTPKAPASEGPPAPPAAAQ